MESKIYTGYVKRRFETSAKLVKSAWGALTASQKAFSNGARRYCCAARILQRLSNIVGLEESGAHDLGKPFIDRFTKVLCLSSAVQVALTNTLTDSGIDGLYEKMSEFHELRNDQLEARLKNIQSLDVKLDTALQFHTQACKELDALEKKGIKVPTKAIRYEVIWKD